MNNTKEIKSVKINGCGYLLNWNIYTNGDNELIKQWLSEGNIPEPEFTDEELIAIEIANKKQEALNYLVNTAWYIERLNDPSSGKAIPEEVLAKRAEARLILDEGAK